MVIIIFFISILVSKMMCFTISSRRFTDYYQSLNGSICVPIHHNFPIGGELLRLYVHYTLRFVDQSIPVERLITTHYLFRVGFCNKKFEFSDRNIPIKEGNLNIAIGWGVTIYEEMASAHYEFTRQLDSNIHELITEDGMFSISVTLKHNIQEYLYKSPEISGDEAYALQSLLFNDTKAICARIDDHKYVVLIPDFVGQFPKEQISQIKIHTETNGQVVEKEYLAYPCGSDNLPTQSDFKIVVKSQIPNSIKFYALYRKQIYRKEQYYWDKVEHQYEFKLNHLSYQLASEHTDLSYLESKMFVFWTSIQQLRCSDRTKFLTITGYDDKHLFGYFGAKEKISQTASRIYFERIKNINQC